MWGTLDYISPEQLIDVHAVDIRSDLYSLGCTLFYFLSGQVPFGGDSLNSRLVKRATEEPECVTKLRPETPAAVAKIVRRLTNPVRARRFQTPRELIAEISPYCSGAHSWKLAPVAPRHNQSHFAEHEETANGQKVSTDTDVRLGS